MDELTQHQKAVELLRSENKKRIAELEGGGRLLESLIKMLCNTPGEAPGWLKYLISELVSLEE